MPVESHASFAVTLSFHFTNVLQGGAMASEIGGQVGAVEKLFKCFMHKFSISRRLSRSRFEALEDSDLLVAATAALKVFDRRMGVGHTGLNI